jgi:maltose alpha-D-glucosyltransferase/alpha-amylase
VVANLSRFVEYVELDLVAYKGVTPIELFGQHAFPRIGDLPYLLTLGPHSFYWFELPAAGARPATPPPPQATRVSGDWSELVVGEARPALERALATVLPTRRWFGGKASR